uniref:Ig-like domain-containing protein n=1 Tax=Poecilia mexicana TaxID=48701 RepID=A0A3B3WIT0_9TELE
MLTPLKMSRRVRTCLLAALFGSLLSGGRVRTEETEPRIVHHPSDVVVKPGSPATLSCRVDGSPKPTIEWLRNGQPLGTDKGDGRAVPMVLSEGSLFFLNVGGGRRGQTHEGVYACVATNSAGKATSRNASLYIAGEMV